MKANGSLSALILLGFSRAFHPTTMLLCPKMTITSCHFCKSQFLVPFLATFSVLSASSSYIQSLNVRVPRPLVLSHYFFSLLAFFPLDCFIYSKSFQYHLIMPPSIAFAVCTWLLNSELPTGNLHFDSYKHFKCNLNFNPHL